ncbi:MAG: FAD-dependent oxidoreductase, partial [Nitrospiria bacterium]
MKQSFDVIIVGAGMGGLILAEVLSRKGYRTAILERQPQFTPVPRGEILQPNGLRIFDQLGLLDEIRAAGPHLNYVFHFSRVGGPGLCTIDYRMLPPPYQYTLIMLPEILMRVLLKRVSDNKDIQIYWGTEFQGLLRDENRVVGVQALHNSGVQSTAPGGSSGGQRLDLMAPVVIGADGVYSRVREEMGVRYRLKTYRHGYLTMLLERPVGFGPEGRYYVGRKTILGLFPVSESHLYLFYLIPAGRHTAVSLPEAETRWPGELEALKKAIMAIDPVVKDTLGGIMGWGQVAYMPCRRVKADRWVADGVALMGDAAHAMNPHVSQGRNQALEDAMVLSEVVAECFRQGDFSKDALS